MLWNLRFQVWTLRVFLFVRAGSWTWWSQSNFLRTSTSDACVPLWFPAGFTWSSRQVVRALGQARKDTRNSSSSIQGPCSSQSCVALGEALQKRQLGFRWAASVSLSRGGSASARGWPLSYYSPIRSPISCLRTPTYTLLHLIHLMRFSFEFTFSKSPLFRFQNWF